MVFDSDILCHVASMGRIHEILRDFEIPSTHRPPAVNFRFRFLPLQIMLESEIWYGASDPYSLLSCSTKVPRSFQRLYHRKEVFFRA
uniref:Uncharacterized protein n=1 Tax=Arundo donax TaxID=35708 RepID=A0A0A9B9W6_ARUDO